MTAATADPLRFIDLKRTHDGLEDEIRHAADRVLRSGWYLLGPELEAFEKELADWNAIAHAVGVANGTDAIELALRAAGVGPGDDVVTVSHTALPTVCAIERAGARPVFAEIDPHTYCMDPRSLAAAITPRTAAVVPVHLYGRPADMTAICQIADQHGLIVVEDCAQAQGSRLGDRLVGSFGHLAAFSFYPTKNLGACGDAGAVLTDDATLADKLRRLRFYGYDDRRQCVERGVNSRLDELQAAILRVKLKRMDRSLLARRALAERYGRSLANVTIPDVAGDFIHAFHLYVVSHPRRDELQSWLAKRGAPTQIHYPVPVHLQPAYQDLGYAKGSLPITEDVCNKILSLPLYVGLETSAVDEVSDAINAFTKGR